MGRNILHILLGVYKEEIGQAFVSYTRVLTQLGEVTCAVGEDVVDAVSERLALTLTAQQLYVLGCGCFPSQVSIAIELRRIITSRNINIIIAHESPSFRMAKLAVLGKKIKIILVRHTDYQSVFSALLSGLSADVVIGTHRGVVSKISKFNNRSYCIYNPVQICENASFKIWNHKQVKSIGENPTVNIGFFGKPGHDGGIHVLIKAVGLLMRGERLNCKLVVHESGKHLHTFINMAKMHNLHNAYVLHHNAHDKYQFFNQVHILCVPMIKDGFNSVILEAMSQKVPVLASDVSGVRDIIKDGETGFLFSPRNFHELANKIEAIISNVHDVGEVVDNAHDKCSTKYSIAYLTSELQRIINLNWGIKKV
ncbi:hypothetical protein MIDIC_200008 [Alphaproteobacteria bacterium]